MLKKLEGLLYIEYDGKVFTKKEILEQLKKKNKKS